jgi:hypothetical protein
MLAYSPVICQTPAQVLRLISAVNTTNGQGLFVMLLTTESYNLNTDEGPFVTFLSGPPPGVMAARALYDSYDTVADTLERTFLTKKIKEPSFEPRNLPPQHPGPESS